VTAWRTLFIAVAVQVVGTWLANAPLFLITHLHLERGLSLPTAGAVAAAALAGTMLTLIAWGVVVDRVGERRALMTGLSIATIAGFASAAHTSSLGWLAITWFAIGVGAGCLNSASGRLIIGWFPPERRGIAMGIRQTALPLGMGMAAFFVPVLASSHGLAIALIVPAAACAVATAVVATFIVDPASQDRALGANPYRADRRLLRIHLASMLLVVPQLTVWTFIVVWLVDARGWTTVAAGGLAAATQVLGALGRIGSGWWSDRAGDRLRPIRSIAVAAAATMVLLGASAPTSMAVIVMVIATVVTVADNGLAFTAVAEIGGHAWSGRAMGIQNTGQYVTGSLVPPLMGAVIAAQGYAIAFALAAAFPLLAIPIVPVPSSAAPKHPGKP
jgi:MFS family permease